MAIIGKYCKSYPLFRLRQFSGWKENAEAARKIRKEINGEIVEAPRQLTDNDYLYLHRDLTVTDGIFIDENVIFNDVTPEWKEFCSHLVDGTRPQKEPDKY